MREDRLDNASWSSRALRTAGRLDIKILWRIPPTRGRTQAPKSMRRANTFQRRRKRFSVTATGNSADSVRTLYHNVSVRRWRYPSMVSFDVRICLLLIKAYSREKPEREKEDALNLSFLGSRMHAWSSKDDDDVVIFCEKCSLAYRCLSVDIPISSRCSFISRNVLRHIESPEHFERR